MVSDKPARAKLRMPSFGLFKRTGTSPPPSEPLRGRRLYRLEYLQSLGLEARTIIDVGVRGGTPVL
jgi:hypothetical protein